MIKIFKMRIGLICLVASLALPISSSAQIFTELCTEIDTQNLQLCDIAIIDGYVGTMTNSTSGIGPNPLCPGGGIASNIMWFAFVAPVGDIQIEITPSNCMPGSTGFSGIQAGIYTDCTFDESLWCSQNCMTQQFTSPSGLFTPGEVYYYFMSGCLGSICDFQIDIIGTYSQYSMPLPDQISFAENTCDPFPLCKGADLELVVENFDTLSVDYEWFISIPDTTNVVINTETGSLQYKFELEGNYTVCFSATNGCEFVSTCEVFNIVQIPEEGFDPVTMCQGDFWLGPEDSEDLNGDGLGWDGAFIIINDDDGVDDGFFIAENLAETDCGCLYLQTVPITIVDDPPTEVIDLEVCNNAFPYSFDNMTFNSPVEDFLIEYPAGAVNGCDSSVLLTIVELPCQSICPPIAPGSMNCDSLQVTPEVLLSDFPANVAPGTELCVPVRVAGFNYIAALQFTISYNPCFMRFLDASQIGTAFEGANEILNTAKSDQGNIGYLWFDSTGSGVCLEDNAILVELCFEFIGEPLDQAEIFLSDVLVEQESGYVANINTSICETEIVSTPAEIMISCDSLHLLRHICYKDNSKSDVSLAACGGIAPYDIYLGGDIKTANADGEYVVFSDYLPSLYTVEITDATGLSKSFPLVIGLDTPLTYVIVETPPSCLNIMDGALTIMQDDSTEFDLDVNKVEWQGNIFNTPTLSGLEDGSYFLTITDQYGCEYVESVNLSALNSTNVIAEDSLCSGSGFSIVVGNDLYNESNPSGTTNLTSNSGCDSVVVVNLGFLDNSALIDDALCSDDQLVINGEVFDINNPMGTVTIAGAGVNGCDSIINVDLSFISFNENVFSETACPGATVNIMGVTLGPNNLTDTILVEDVTGMACDTLNIFQLMYHPDAINEIGGTYCEDETVIINGETFDILNSSGVQTLENASALGCDSTIIVDLEYNEHTRMIIDTTLCFGEVFKFGGGVYISPVENQMITFTDGDENGCDLIVDLTVDFNDEIKIALLTLDPDTGGGTGRIVIDVTGAEQPLNIAWSNGVMNTNEISNLVADTYSVTVTDATGCSVTEFFEVILMTDVIDIGQTEIFIYPNPFDDLFIVDVREEFSEIQIDLYSHTGKRVFTGLVKDGKNTIGVQDLTSGLYVYTLTIDNGDIIRGKLIKN